MSGRLLALSTTVIRSGSARHVLLTQTPGEQVAPAGQALGQPLGAGALVAQAHLHVTELGLLGGQVAADAGQALLQDGDVVVEVLLQRRQPVGGGAELLLVRLLPRDAVLQLLLGGALRDQRTRRPQGERSKNGSRGDRG